MFVAAGLRTKEGTGKQNCVTRLAGGQSTNCNQRYKSMGGSFMVRVQRLQRSVHHKSTQNENEN